MILADTSAWVEYDRATGSAVDRRLTDLLATGGPLASTEAVLMEVLAGARSEARWRDLRRLLSSVGLLPVEPTADFEAAARLYRSCRAVGVTPRGMVDCLIVAVALRTGSSLLTADIDLVRVAEVVGVTVDDAMAT